jgi:ABC-type glycerol-3-phosphate transport system substrate-binding protein
MPVGIRGSKAAPVQFSYMARSESTLFAAAIALVIGLLNGCGGPQQSAPTDKPSNSSRQAGTAAATAPKLQLLVVGDAALAQKIARLRGEWLARTGAALDVSEMGPADLAKEKSLAADVIIYPSAELGTLVQRRLIRALPPSWVDRADYHKADLFELPGLRETAWGEQTYAVPLGSPVFVCFYRPDLFEQLGRRPPQTWTEYQQLVELFAAKQTPTRRSAAPLESATLEPLAPGWAGKVLLARAAAYAKHPDYYSTLFDKETLEPRIATEPFVRALTELVATAKLGPKSQLEDAPADVRREFFAGHAAMALSWPTAADRLPPTHGPSPLSMGFVELPGSAEVFNPRDRQWTPRKSDDDPHVPLLGIAGRLGSSARGTPSADAAFELLVWLSGDEWSAQVSTASSATTLFRHSQLEQPQRWVEAGMSQAAAKQYSDVAAVSFSRPGWLFAPRLPGHEEYMAALDDAVRRAVAGSVSPAAALTEAAARWQNITGRLGRSDQQKAYCRSLGLEP